MPESTRTAVRAVPATRARARPCRSRNRSKASGARGSRGVRVRMLVRLRAPRPLRRALLAGWRDVDAEEVDAAIPQPGARRSLDDLGGRRPVGGDAGLACW